MTRRLSPIFLFALVLGCDSDSGAPCTTDALHTAAENGSGIAEGLEFTVTDPNCQGGYAAARISGDNPSSDDATATFKDNGGGWTLLNVGTDIRCPQGGIPDETCAALLGSSAGATSAPKGAKVNARSKRKGG